MKSSIRVLLKCFLLPAKPNPERKGPKFPGKPKTSFLLGMVLRILELISPMI